ncbi:hypothetical protein [Streptomyces sp. NPDC057052]|uniref:hypothetical protein n=1 Tax=Streptomyces sp. NPDC057052 TaxID=3346010 RepID=UPI0036296785
MSAPTTRCTEGLTADNAALVLIDHQTGIMPLGVQGVPPVQMRNNAVSLAKAARLHNLPTVLTGSAADGPNGPLRSEITDLLPGVPRRRTRQ